MIQCLKVKKQDNNSVASKKENKKRKYINNTRVITTLRKDENIQFKICELYVRK